MKNQNICLALLSCFGIALAFACSQPVAYDASQYSKKTSSNSTGAVSDDESNDDATGSDADEEAEKGSSPVATSPGPSTVTPSPSPPSPTPSPSTTPGASTEAAATGNLSVGLTYVKPSTNGTHYTRGHVRAVWITGVQGGKDVYLRTIESFGIIRSTNLQRWMLFSNEYTIDGVTQATKAYVANGLKDPTVALTWDLKDKDGKVQPLGSYKVWFELATGNTSGLDPTKIEAAQNLGNGYAFYVLPFELTAATTTVQDNKSPVFTNIKVTHTK